jgi:hypothetical protein
MMTPFPGTVDFLRWEKAQEADPEMVGGVPLTRYWLIPASDRPKMFTPHPSMSADEIRERTQGVWDRFYSLGSIWTRSNCVKSLKARVMFVLIAPARKRPTASPAGSPNRAVSCSRPSRCPS